MEAVIDWKYLFERSFRMLVKGVNTEQRIRFLYVLMLGFFIGIIVMNLGKEILLQEGNILGRTELEHFKAISINRGNLFLYVLWARLRQVLLLTFLAFTFFRVMAIYGFVGFMGFAFGMVSSAASIQYGLRGTALMLAAGMPHMLLYIPAYIWLLEWCYNLSIQRGEIVRNLAKYILFILVTIIGVFLESYVNPEILKSILKIF